MALQFVLCDVFTLDVCFRTCEEVTAVQQGGEMVGYRLGPPWHVFTCLLVYLCSSFCLLGPLYRGVETVALKQANKNPALLGSNPHNQKIVHFMGFSTVTGLYNHHPCLMSSPSNKLRARQQPLPILPFPSALAARNLLCVSVHFLFFFFFLMRILNQMRMFD